MSSEALGKRLGISGQGVRKLEQAEADASISLKTLVRLAHGLDSELHYVLLPRTGLIDQVRSRTHDLAHEDLLKTTSSVSSTRDLRSEDALTDLLRHVSGRGFW